MPVFLVRLLWLFRHWNETIYKVLCVACLLLLAACSSDVQELHETRFMMGTLVAFTVMGVDKKQAQQAVVAAANEMQRVEDAFTIYGSAENDVKRFNHTAVRQLFPLNMEVSELLQTALDIQQKSEGAFNPALGALNQLWGFSQTPPPTKPPSDKVIAERREGLDDCLRHRQAGWWRLSEQCQLDFGGIAKGYAIDRGIEVLKKHGVHDAMINAGGDIRLIGQHGDKPWRIGVRDPREEKKMLAILQLQGDVSIVTSGDYERFFMYHDKRYHHILDAGTGYPSMQSQSVTVIASTATLADAWSTALFVAGASALKLADKYHLQILRVDVKGNVSRSKPLRGLVQ